jgi:hypothetical protein
MKALAIALVSLVLVACRSQEATIEEAGAVTAARAGYVVDEPIDAHAVPPERAREAIGAYRTLGVLRVVSATKDDVVFSFNGGPGRARFAGKPGQIDVAAFPAGRLFIGGLSNDPTSEPAATTTWAILSVASEAEGQALIKEIETKRPALPPRAGEKR